MWRFLQWPLVCLACLYGPAAGARDGGQQTPIQPLDFFELEYASDVQISPDGERVLYVRNAADVMTDERTSSIWLTDFDGAIYRPISGDAKTSREPRWSPRGDRIAYIADGQDGSELRVRWIDTDDEIVAAKLSFPPRDITWSPDGSWIAFAMLEPSSPTSYAALPAPPGGANWKKPAHITDKLLYQFNGVGVYPNGAVHVYTVPANGGTPHRVTEDGFRYGDFLFGSGGIDWSKDSKQVIVAANFGDKAELEPVDTELYSYSVDGGLIRQITDRVGPDYRPRVSPDGSKIAYLGFNDRSQGYQTTLLHVVSFDGGEPRVVGEEIDQSILDFQWASNGRSLLASYDEHGVTKLARISLGGRHEVLNESLGGGFGLSAYGGELGAGPFTIADNGRYAAVYADPETPGDVAVSTGDRRRLKRITDLNSDVLNARQLGKVETIWYESSVDRQRVQGWLIYPPDFDPSKKYPLILEIHGGPFANYGPRFDIEKQYMAAQGYVVLYTNPRGSTSYGEEFGNAIHHSYPGDDYYDLMSGVDAVVEKGFIDPGRLYVTGGSGGGTLTAWLISKTDRFQASSVHYPVIDWASFALTSDASTYVLKYWFADMPWENPEHYRARSPIDLVDKVSTPTLILCGENDLRTPLSQAEMYYTALKLYGVEAAMVRVPDEPHGSAAHPSHQLTKVMNTVGWFALHDGKRTVAAIEGD